ncbi:hypothetical protein CHGG_01220 [Chaetomium globosum CBS 148.51]|uniref:D-isomer specific 2-hydroxyacid dehydrogenase NAD-binding domain-containing protein n=1 Tax=Chaetomium globosum (strain ATCC 6205 / CBS 148.51 / DSM 1962 / NBRC 6347 / NRRL 1970) TaxID=306901 RepID=Q2HEY4_CHAGB|nr:uncharacterized protein CHGG_01220 [Chaetomium globosum CBS 148.51]EAQ92985.1 hypothetical protein CHGG_01220 [Chaetomium globosum CBS 148.51]
MLPPVPRDYQSATEYRFGENQVNDIIHFAGCRREGFPPCVIWFPQASIPRLRQTNTGARRVVDALSQYQVVASHGLIGLCALLRTRLAATVSLLDFHRVLCTEACALCGDFSGGIVSLPTWSRCCFRCLWAAPETQIRSLGGVRKLFDFSKVQLASLHPFKTLGGICTREAPPQSPRAVVSLHQATLLAGQQKEDCSAYSDNWKGQKYNFLGACELPYYNRRTGEAEHGGIFCAGCELAFEERADKTGDAAAWAVQACDTMLSKEAFLEHFKWCKELPVRCNTHSIFDRTTLDHNPPQPIPSVNTSTNTNTNPQNKLNPTQPNPPPPQKMNLAVFSAKPYDRDFLTLANSTLPTHHTLTFHDFPLTADTAPLASGADAVCVFVNDALSAPVLQTLHAGGTRAILLRCAGYNHVDLAEAERLGLAVANVPAYAPEAVAEFAAALLQTLNRRTHRARGPMLINTSRGGLVRTESVIAALKSKHLGGLALDVYEAEAALFYQDHSAEIIQDDELMRLMTFPNVVVCGHQAFFTEEALTEIAECTMRNLDDFYNRIPCKNALVKEGHVLARRESLPVRI